MDEADKLMQHWHTWDPQNVIQWFCLCRVPERFCQAPPSVGVLGFKAIRQHMQPTTNVVGGGQGDP